MAIKTIYKFTCDNCGLEIERDSSDVGTQLYIYAIRIFGWKILRERNLQNLFRYGKNVICKTCSGGEDKTNEKTMD